MKKNTPIGGYLGTYRGISPLGNRLELSTSNSIKDELFSAIDYLFEIKENGVKHIMTFGFNKRDAGNVFLKVQGYVRQAKSFYESAETLNYRSSALLYYYSFLNLAKAFCCLKEKSFHKKFKVRHGLIQKFKENSFKKQFVSVSAEKEVFQFLYKSFFNKELPKILNLNIVSLLSYCTDITYEYESAGYGSRRMLRTKYALVTDIQNTQSWTVLAISEFHKLKAGKFNKNLKNFYKYYSQVEINNNDAKTIFHISGDVKPVYSFFESNKKYNHLPLNSIDLFTIQSDCYNSIGDMFSLNPFKDEFDFSLALPLEKSKLPFNEALAIYVGMFYLSSLVRYQPYYLEKLLNSKSSWIIERFVKSTPQTFLRYMVNMITKKDLVFINR